MNDSPMPPKVQPDTISVKGPREALGQFVADVCRDLESRQMTLLAAGTGEQLIAAADDTYKTLVSHAQNMGEYVQVVRDWRENWI
jgi:hypothetical protein